MLSRKDSRVAANMCEHSLTAHEILTSFPNERKTGWRSSKGRNVREKASRKGTSLARARLEWFIGHGVSLRWCCSCFSPCGVLRGGSGRQKAKDDDGCTDGRMCQVWCGCGCLHKKKRLNLTRCLIISGGRDCFTGEGICHYLGRHVPVGARVNQRRIEC